MLLALALIGGFCLHAGVSHVYAGLHDRRGAVHLAFGATALAAFVFYVTDLAARSEHSWTSQLALQRWLDVAGTLFLLGLIWFLSTLSPRRLRPAYVALAVGHVVALAWVLSEPDLFLLGRLVQNVPLELPWGEVVAAPRFESAPASIVHSLLLLLTLGMTVVAVRSLVKRGGWTPLSFALGSGLAILMATILWDNAGQFLPTGGVLVADLSFFALLLPMSLTLTSAAGRRALEDYNAQLESQVVERTAELRESEARFRALVSNLPGVVYRFVLDGPRTLLYVSDGIEALVGLTPDELMGRSARRFARSIHPEDRAEATRQRRAAAAGGEPFELIYRVVDREGRTRWAREWGRAVRAEGNAPAYVDGVVFDVTEQYLLEERLRQSQKLEALGRLAGGVAHDFNNLLTTIIAGCDAVDLGLPEDSPVRRELRVMSNAARRGGELTRELLDYARARPRKDVEFDAGDVIREALRLVERAVGGGIEVRERLSATKTLVRGDPGALTDSLLNLAMNSRAAMPAGGELRVETRNVAADEARRLALGEFEVAPGTHLEVAVSDQGSGIAQGDLPRIFDPFFSTKPAGEGSGLGLASVYAAMQGMHGAIGVHSAEGSGTSIRLFLPVRSWPTGAPPGG